MMRFFYKLISFFYHKIVGAFYDKTIGVIVYNIKLSWYWYKLPPKINKIRSKSKIKVLFVVSTLRTWKGLTLYKNLRSHERFEPLIGVNTYKKYPDAKIDLINFLEENNYNYIDVDNGKSIIDKINPDIIIYDSPYPQTYSKGVSFYDNLKYVFCGCDYCINITKHIAHLKHPWYDFCWQFYVEHEDVAKRKKEILGKKARNIYITGVPNQDELSLPKTVFVDPWKDKTGKKRIIYAPHHSFKGFNGEGIEFATFMDYGEFMLELADKYKEQITIAFKPHPFLYIRLLGIWGKEKTDYYYSKWSEMENTQFENGDYFGLFKYSDAIIHDCASFIVEYLYMDKPSMFLVAESNNIDDMFDFVKDCYNCHEHAYRRSEIETFIQNVISGVDKKQAERQSCIIKQLLPPNGRTACENIINAILYE